MKTRWGKLSAAEQSILDNYRAFQDRKTVDDRIDRELFKQLVDVVYDYLATADAGPRGRPGVEQLYVIDDRARRLLDRVETVRRMRLERAESARSKSE